MYSICCMAKYSADAFALGKLEHQICGAITLPTISPKRFYSTWKLHKLAVITRVYITVAMGTRKVTSSMFIHLSLCIKWMLKAHSDHV